MPVHSTGNGGKQWGNHGKVYHGKGAAAKAAAQGRAAYANGYKGKDKSFEHHKKMQGKAPTPDNTNH